MLSLKMFKERKMLNFLKERKMFNYLMVKKIFYSNSRKRRKLKRSIKVMEGI